MKKDSVSLQFINNIEAVEIDFEYPKSNIIVITGRNGAGKTTIVKSFHLLYDPDIYSKSSGEDAVSGASKISFSLDGIEPFCLHYNNDLGAFDTRDRIPNDGVVISELPIPFGARFQQFSKIAKFDGELKINIASNDYAPATELIEFLSEVYLSRKFDNLQSTVIKNNKFFFLLKENDYYMREDHFSSGEFFLIQLYRLITTGAKLIVVDELDVALDAVAQTNLYASIKPILRAHDSRLIVISHSLAFMATVDDGGLYYLEASVGKTSLQERSFGYIKSDLFGFRGYDRYILTEDAVLEGFIEFLIRHCSIDCHYRHITIGVAGANQLRMILEKNNSKTIFTDSDKVLCIVDGDVFPTIERDYAGPTRIIPSPVNDLECYLYSNRDTLLSNVELPTNQESRDLKRASKTYWKWLKNNKGLSEEQLYQVIVESREFDSTRLVQEIKTFLRK